MQAADQVGALVAIQHRIDQFEGQLRVLAHPVGQVVAQHLLELVEVAFEVVVGDVEGVVAEDLLQRAAQVALRRVAAHLRQQRLGAQCRSRGVDEHVAVVDAVVAEQAAEDRVVPGLGQLVVEARVDQGDVGALYQWPVLHVEQLPAGKALAQALDHLVDLVLVEIDPLCRGLLGLLPLGLFEARAGAVGDAAEAITVVVEALQDALGDFGGGPVLGHGGVSRRTVRSASLARGRGEEQPAMVLLGRQNVGGPGAVVERTSCRCWPAAIRRGYCCSSCSPNRPSNSMEDR
ncbi:hypothetical protein D3C84_477570 [compost metagenome]